MPSKFKSYNKRTFITIDEKEVLKERCIMNLLEGVVADRPDIVLATDRAYQRMPDGSLRRVKVDKKKQETVKLERRPNVTNQA